MAKKHLADTFFAFLILTQAVQTLPSVHKLDVAHCLEEAKRKRT